MMVLPNPRKLMVGYLLGALMTSVTLGLVIVFEFEGSSAVGTTKQNPEPGGNDGAGRARSRWGVSAGRPSS